MSEDSDIERELRIALMSAQIEHYKQQSKWEPWKVMAAVITATAALFGVLGGLVGFLIGHVH